MNNKATYKGNRNLGVWGGVISLIVLRSTGEMLPSFIFSILALAGLSIVLWGCWNWTKYKDRSGWWALWGLLTPIGLIPLALMEHKYKKGNEPKVKQALNEQEAEKRLAKIHERMSHE